MCGIAGFVGDGDVKVLTRMIEKLRYRGPDDLGVWHEGNIGLAHSRLSIIDLSKRGHQPMHSIDGKIIITFNGEIYNFRELKTKLEQKGKIFKSQSDTEVIIQLYEVYGEESFEKLEGMFAFGLYDKKEEKFMLVRDRMGEKPLYWTIENDTLIFASEVKAILEYSNSSKKINPQSIISYLSHDSVLTPKSIYSNINKLEPATYAVYKNKKIRKNKYWNPPQKISNNKSFSEISESLDNALEKSVRDRLVADVPVGVFLSGGLDSSIIAYYATKNSNKPVHTFSLGFHEKSYDESKYARECANFLGTEHHEKIVSADEVRDALHTVVKKFDEPIADPAILPNYLLSSFAKERVKVALGGDGGDELFAGYQTFTADKLLNSYQMLPEVVRKNLIEPLVNSLPVSHRYFSLDFKAKQFIRGVNTTHPYVHQAWLASFNRKEMEEILTANYKSAITEGEFSELKEYVAEVQNYDIHTQETYIYIRSYLQDVILAKVDRTSMYNSLEVRSPFLDSSVVNMALEMPWHFKYKGLTGKFILRKLMKGRLPNSIVKRGKHGFGLPVGQWFCDQWRELLLDKLSKENVSFAGVFNPFVVEHLIEEHLNKSHNHRKKLWSLLVFHMWYDSWIKNNK